MSRGASPYTGLSFESLLMAQDFGLIGEAKHINADTFSKFCEIVASNPPKGVVERGRNEPIVDWIARTYGLSTTMFLFEPPDKDMAEVYEKEPKLAQHVEAISLASNLYLFDQSRPPVFYIEDIAEQFRIMAEDSQYKSIFAPMLDIPLKPPYFSTIFVHSSRYTSLERDKTYEVAVHVMDVDDTVIMTPYVSPHERDEPTPPIVVGHVEINLDRESFKLIDGTMHGSISIYPNKWEEYDELEPAYSAKLKDAAVSLVQSTTAPALYTMFLLNCRNVDSEEEIVHRSRQERRERERRGLAENRSYRVRVKLPKRKQYVYYGGRNVIHQEDVPMHMVRGHFSHYTEEKPLFGKYPGTFWIPSHIRGSKTPDKFREGYEASMTGENE